MTSFIVIGLGSCSKKVNVYPSAASKLKNIELGEAIYMLMPDEDTKFLQWSHQSNNENIFWLNEGYKSTNGENGYNSREGLVRINVQGVKSTILKKTLEELAWTITYINRSNPKFGPQVIELKPGLSNSDGICFGTNFDNCTFNPINSLIGRNINFDIVCKSKALENWGKTGLLLSAKGKKTIKARWQTDGGSGGSSSIIEIYVGEQPDKLCD